MLCAQPRAGPSPPGASSGSAPWTPAAALPATTAHALPTCPSQVPSPECAGVPDLSHGLRALQPVALLCRRPRGRCRRPASASRAAASPAAIVCPSAAPSSAARASAFIPCPCPRPASASPALPPHPAASLVRPPRAFGQHLMRLLRRTGSRHYRRHRARVQLCSLQPKDPSPACSVHRR